MTSKIKHLETPILFLVFNRPEPTKMVFEKIREQKPKKLFIAADGPRSTDEANLCSQVREYVISRIDWECDVKTLFRDDNLGCGKAVSEAITWFFTHVNQGIILEDDTLPNKSFFSFCEQLLEYYQKDEQIMHISGDNFQFGKPRGTGSYYFSKHTHVWGWATWKRAWEKYDFEMSHYPQLRAKIKRERLFDLEMLDGTFAKKINTWDVQWLFTVYFAKGKSILPNVNLVDNIGFNIEATHTKDIPEWYKKQTLGEIHNIIHPNEILFNKKADYYTAKYHYNINRNQLFEKLKPIIVRIKDSINFRTKSFFRIILK